MGSGHFYNILDGKCPSVEVTAVCDIDSSKLENAKKYSGISLFTNSTELLDSGLVDAVLIAVPHYQHPEIAIAAFEQKIHVLTEKPAGVYTRQVREMKEAADRS